MDLIWIIYIVDNFAGNPFPSWILWVTIGLIISVLIGSIMSTDLKNIGASEKKPCILTAVNQIKPFKFWIIILLVVGGISSAMNMVVPSKDTAYKMIAAYGVTEIMQTDKAKRLGGKSLEVLEKVMDEYLKESEAK